MPQELATVDELVAQLRQHGLGRGGFLALSLAGGRGEPGIGLAAPSGDRWALAYDQPAAVVGRAGGSVPAPLGVVVPAHPGRLVEAGVRVATCWDLAAVHRLLFGGWRAEPARIWAAAARPARRLDARHRPARPARPGGDEGTDAGGPGAPGRPPAAGMDRRRLGARSGPAGAVGRHRAGRPRVCSSGALARRPGGRRRRCRPPGRSRPPSCCAPNSPSTACRWTGPRAEQLIAALRRPAAARRPRPTRQRAAPGRRGAAAGRPACRRHRPAQPGAGAGRCWAGSASRCPTPGPGGWSRSRGAHPVVDGAARLAQGRADRHHLRLRLAGRATSARTAGCAAPGPARDGAAGRMTASAGLHNMPAELRPAVAAEPGPRVRPGRPRPDRAAGAGRGVRRPRAGPGRRRRTTCTRRWPPGWASTGRPPRSRCWPRCTARPRARPAQALQRAGVGVPGGDALPARRRRGRPGRAATCAPTAAGWCGCGRPGRAGRRGRSVGQAAARGRYARNAMVQGAAAELFKVWAVTVRARAAGAGRPDRAVPARRAAGARAGRARPGGAAAARATAWPRRPTAGRRTRRCASWPTSA